MTYRFSFFLATLLFFSTKLCASSVISLDKDKFETCYLGKGAAAKCQQFSANSGVEHYLIKLEKTGSDYQSLPPIVFISGGPGQAASDAMLPLVQSMHKIREKRDFILIDQLGTGQSMALNCDELNSLSPLAQLEKPKLLEAKLLICAEKIKNSGNEAKLYGTDAHANSIEEVRKALGSEKIALYGISYGTRVAVRYAMKFPESVERIVLEGVAGNELFLWNNISTGRPLALDAIDERLKLSKENSSEQSQNFSSRVNALLSQLPSSTTIRDPNTGSKVEVNLSKSLMWQAVSMSFYDPTLVSILPHSVDKAISGDYQALLTPLLSADTGVNMLLFFTVACSEDFRSFAKLPPELSTEDKRMIVQLCEAWPKYEIEEDFRKKPKFGAPTLLLAGEADPATPITVAQSLNRSLPNSKLLSVPWFGHNVFYLPCIQKNLEKFFASPRLNGLDKLDGCGPEVLPPNFFINDLGPK